MSANVPELERFQTAKVTFKVTHGYWCRCPAHVVQWSNHLGAMCMTFAVAEDRFEPRPWRIRLLKKNYFK